MSNVFIKRRNRLSIYAKYIRSNDEPRNYVNDQQYMASGEHKRIKEFGWILA